MFKGFNLPKGLLDSAEGLLKEVNEQDKKFNALLEEYGITTPMQLSEQKQVEFLKRATEMLGEGYTGLRKLKEAINLREYDGMGGGITQHEKMIKRKADLSAKLHKEEEELKEASNEAPNIQRLTLTQEEKRKLKEIGSDSMQGLSEEPVETMKNVKMVHQEETDEDDKMNRVRALAKQALEKVKKKAKDDNEGKR